ncbi:MAG TPA: RNA chaperone Hfq [Halanaerobiales bacterium]|nr:RNA chaperone Hfq [Halanaerobiales bacterium]
MKNKVNIQDTILNHVRKQSIGVKIYLMNGVQLKGKVIGFDDFTILLEVENDLKVIYKHAVSTIEPQENIKDVIFNNYRDKKKNES